MRETNGMYSLGTRLRPLLAMAGAVLLSGVLMLLCAGPARATDVNVLTASEPPASATLATPPRQIILNFRWRIKHGSTVVTVLGPDGVTQWQRDKPVETDRGVGVGLRALGPAGKYAVNYQGRSVRGLWFHGTMEFVLAPPSNVAGRLPLAWIASVLLLTAGGTMLGIRLGRINQ